MDVVNPVSPDEYDAWAGNMQTAFLQPPDPAARTRFGDMWRHRLEPERSWGVRDRGRWVATLATDERTITVPGGRTLTADALTGVTVSATHRRRGLLSTLITASLAAARERGDAVSYLVAAEWPIYGRFGYGPATRVAKYTLHTRAPGAVLQPGPGSVRQVDPAEYAELAPVAFRRAFGLRAGEISRSDRAWRSQLDDEPREGRLNLLLHEGEGGADGLLTWRPVRDFELGEHLGAIEVHDLLAGTADAYRNLWAYLLGVDVVEQVRLLERPVDEPARHLLRDGRALQQTFAGDVTWLRILDVPAALSARAYRAPGRLVLDVVDTAPGGYAAGRWLLETTAAGAQCTPTDAEPDLTLTAQQLGSAYLGDYPLAMTSASGGVEEHSPGAVATFDLLFGTTVLPWCSSGF